MLFLKIFYQVQCDLFSDHSNVACSLLHISSQFSILFSLWTLWYAGKYLTTSIPKHTNEKKKKFLAVSAVHVLPPWLISRCLCDGSEHRVGKNVGD